MGLREQFEEYRRQQVWKLKQEEQRLNAQAAKLHEQQAEIQAKKLEVEQNAMRLDDNPPIEGACPDCFFHGRAPSQLTPVPSETQADKFRCRICGYETELEA